jgi:2-haloacid dehalogenase
VTYKPKFISFDCYGTLINFEMGPTEKKLFEDRVPSERMPAFLDSFRFYRLDEVLGEWKPFFDVVENAIQRTCKKHGIEYRPADALALYEAVPTWQPHPNVVETLEAIAPHVPLVILSNSMVDLIPPSVAHLNAPFHAVYSAEQARAYTPRAQMFEYMFDQLGCGAGADDARLLKLSLRPDDRLGSGLHGQGLHRPWSRACQMEKALFSPL